MISDTTFTARGDADPRVAELSELAASEGLRFGIGLPAAIDFTLWLEDRGFVVDFRTGVAMRMELVEQVAEVTVTGEAVHHIIAPATDDDLDALIDEVYGKPGLGVEDSAGVYDVDPVDEVEAAYWHGTGDQAAGCYNPPRANPEAHEAYIKGHNDAWAKANKVSWWRRGTRG